MGQVSENWSEYVFERGIGAQRGFIVTGVRDAAEALSDLLNQKGVALNASHELDNRLIAGEPVVDTRLGPNVYHAVASYNSNGAGGGSDGKIRWSWRSITREESVDIDASDPPLPIINTAGSPFQSDFTRPFNSRILIARRVEDSYRSGVADDFENSVNKFRIVVPRVGIFEPGRLKLLSYEPEDEYTSDEGGNSKGDSGGPPIACIYQFEVRKGSKLDPDGTWDGFKFRIRNDGFMGFGDVESRSGEEGDEVDPSNPGGGGGEGGRGAFATAAGRVAEPVLLDRSGKPLDTAVLVEVGIGTTAVAVDNPDASQIPDSVIEITPSGVVFLKYLKCPVMDFKGLALFT